MPFWRAFVALYQFTFRIIWPPCIRELDGLVHLPLFVVEFSRVWIRKSGEGFAENGTRIPVNFIEWLF